MAPEPGQSGDDGVEIPLSNAWPTGLQTMGCLACDGPFISSGRHERLCSACRRRTWWFGRSRRRSKRRRTPRSCVRRCGLVVLRARDSWCAGHAPGVTARVASHPL